MLPHHLRQKNGKSHSFILSVQRVLINVIGGSNHVAPLIFLQCFTIERLGRRPLIIGGFGVMGMCCAGITLSLILQVSEMKLVSEVNVIWLCLSF